jgi:hypothetical protein
MSSAISLTAAPTTVERTQVPSRHLWQRRYARVLRITDIAIVVVAVVLALTLRFGVPSATAEVIYLIYAVIAATVVIVWLSFLSVFRSREPKILGGGPEEYRRVFTATVSAFGAIAIVSMVAKLELTRGYLAIAHQAVP